MIHNEIRNWIIYILILIIIILAPLLFLKYAENKEIHKMIEQCIEINQECVGSLDSCRRLLDSIVDPHRQEK